MGGWNSGGGRSAPKTSEMLRLDLADLRRLGMLEIGRHSSVRWSRYCGFRATIGVRRRSRELELDYQIRSYGGEWRQIRDVIPLETTAQHFGGERIWFACPSCNGRCRTLYGGVYFRCRACQRATYVSQYESSYERVISRAQGARIRLGGSGNMLDDFPPKPKWMRWKTYERLAAKDDYALSMYALIFHDLQKRLQRRKGV